MPAETPDYRAEALRVLHEIATTANRSASHDALTRLRAAELLLTATTTRPGHNLQPAKQNLIKQIPGGEQQRRTA